MGFRSQRIRLQSNEVWGQAWMLPFHTEVPDAEYIVEEREQSTGGTLVLDDILENWEGVSIPEDPHSFDCLLVGARSYRSDVDLLGIAF